MTALWEEPSPGTARSPEGQGLAPLPFECSFQPLLGGPGIPSRQELQGRSVGLWAAVHSWAVLWMTRPPAIPPVEQPLAQQVRRVAGHRSALLRGGLTELAQGAPGGGARAGSQAFLWGRAGRGAGRELGCFPPLLLLTGLGHATQGRGPPQGAFPEGILKGTRTKAVRIPSREVGKDFIPLQAFAHDVPSPRKVLPPLPTQVLLLKSYLLFEETLPGHHFCNAFPVPHLHEPPEHACALLPYPYGERVPVAGKAAAPRGDLGSNSCVTINQLCPLWQVIELLCPSLPSPVI